MDNAIFEKYTCWLQKADDSLKAELAAVKNDENEIYNVVLTIALNKDSS